MLHLRAIKSIAAIVLVVASFTACKKDAFSEKDAITAQTSLLQTKFSYDLAIKQVELQIQRSGDSAKIVIQNLVNSGATALEILKQTNMLAQILQNQTNLLAAYRYNDSLQRSTAVISDQLSRVRALWTDSVNRAATNIANAATLKLQLQRNYVITVVDFNGSNPIAGASVSVLPYGATTIVTATTNASGIAKFDGLTVDPATSFIISATNYGSVLVQENSMINAGTALQTSGSLSVQTTSKSATVQLYNPTTNRNTVAGSILGDLDLTNGDAVEGIPGQLITFASNSVITLNGVSAVYQFPTLSDASGNFSIKLPDGTFTTAYPNIKVQQSLFVNAWQDEDASAAMPRIAVIGTTLATNTGFNISSGTALGYYFQFPTDANGKTVIAANATSFPNNNNNMFSPYIYAFNNIPPFPFTNIGGASIRTDSIGSSVNFFNNWYFNNSNTQATTETARYRTRAGTAAEPFDTVAVSVVSLVPGWLVKAPLLKTVVSGPGYINNLIQLQRQDNSQFIQTVVVAGAVPQTPVGPTNTPQGIVGVNYTPNPAYAAFKKDAGGQFNQAAMHTPTNRNAFTNLSFANQTYTPTNNLVTNNTFITVSGGRSYFLPIEYKWTVSRDRNPR